MARAPTNNQAWCFLDVRDPMCAWNTYRGAMHSAPTWGSYLSIRAASIYRRFAKGDSRAVAIESALEWMRRVAFPRRLSRLRALYCFTSLRSAERALEWGSPSNHFRPKFLAELNLRHAERRRNTLDANWITYAPPISRENLQEHIPWLASYWAGEAMPGKEPLWETLMVGRVLIVSDEIRERAYERIRALFPQSIVEMEISRLAATIGKDRGNLTAFARDAEGSPDEVEIAHVMNLEDRPALLKRVGILFNQHADEPRVKEASTFFDRGLTPMLAPDLTPSIFRIPRRFDPYAVSGSREVAAHLGR